MTATIDRAPAGRRPLQAWIRDPAGDDQQLTHAVPVDDPRRGALCGAPITVTGSPWPDSPEHWHERSGRCPLCAKAVYGDGG